MFGIFNRHREKKESIKKAQLIIKEFVEGNVTLDQFWETYINDTSIRKYISKNGDILAPYYSFFDVDAEALRRIRLNNIGIRVSIYHMCKLYLQVNKIECFPKNDDETKYNKLSSICPSWLQFDEELLSGVIKNAPKNLNKSNRIKWCKAEISNMFKVDKYYPEWLQNPEWPIVDGTPLVFRKQSHSVNDIYTDRIKYYFYHPETDEETIVEQFD